MRIIWLLLFLAIIGTAEMARKRKKGAKRRGKARPRKGKAKQKKKGTTPRPYSPPLGNPGGIFFSPMPPGGFGSAVPGGNYGGETSGGVQPIGSDAGSYTAGSYGGGFGEETYGGAQIVTVAPISASGPVGNVAEPYGFRKKREARRDRTKRSALAQKEDQEIVQALQSAWLADGGKALQFGVDMVNKGGAAYRDSYSRWAKDHHQAGRLRKRSTDNNDSLKRDKRLSIRMLKLAGTKRVVNGTETDDEIKLDINCTDVDTRQPRQLTTNLPQRDITVNLNEYDLPPGDSTINIFKRDVKNAENQIPKALTLPLENYEHHRPDDLKSLSKRETDVNIKPNILDSDSDSTEYSSEEYEDDSSEEGSDEDAESSEEHSTITSSSIVKRSVDTFGGVGNFPIIPPTTLPSTVLGFDFQTQAFPGAVPLTTSMPFPRHQGHRGNRYRAGCDDDYNGDYNDYGNDNNNDRRNQRRNRWNRRRRNRNRKTSASDWNSNHNWTSNRWRRDMSSATQLLPLTQSLGETKWNLPFIIKRHVVPENSKPQGRTPEGSRPEPSRRPNRSENNGRGPPGRDRPRPEGHLVKRNAMSESGEQGRRIPESGRPDRQYEPNYSQKNERGPPGRDGPRPEGHPVKRNTMPENGEQGRRIPEGGRPDRSYRPNNSQKNGRDPPGRDGPRPEGHPVKRNAMPENGEQGRRIPKGSRPDRPYGPNNSQKNGRGPPGRDRPRPEGHLVKRNAMPESGEQGRRIPEGGRPDRPYGPNNSQKNERGPPGRDRPRPEGHLVKRNAMPENGEQGRKIPEGGRPDRPYGPNNSQKNERGPPGRDGPRPEGHLVKRNAMPDNGEQGRRIPEGGRPDRPYGPNNSQKNGIGPPGRDLPRPESHPVKRNAMPENGEQGRRIPEGGRPDRPYGPNNSQNSGRGLPDRDYLRSDDSTRQINGPDFQREKRSPLDWAPYSIAIQPHLDENKTQVETMLHNNSLLITNWTHLLNQTNTESTDADNGDSPHNLLLFKRQILPDARERDEGKLPRKRDQRPENWKRRPETRHNKSKRSPGDSTIENRSTKADTSMRLTHADQQNGHINTYELKGLIPRVFRRDVVRENFARLPISPIPIEDNLPQADNVVVQNPLLRIRRQSDSTFELPLLAAQSAEKSFTHADGGTHDNEMAYSTPAYFDQGFLVRIPGFRPGGELIGVENFMSETGMEYGLALKKRHATDFYSAGKVASGNTDFSTKHNMDSEKLNLVAHIRH